MKELYAHSPNDNGQWHGLEEHLNEVAVLPKAFTIAGATAYLNAG